MRDPRSMPRPWSRRLKLFECCIKFVFECIRGQLRLRASSCVWTSHSYNRQAVAESTPPGELEQSKVCEMTKHVRVQRAARVVAFTRVQTPKGAASIESRLRLLCVDIALVLVPHLSAPGRAHSPHASNIPSVCGVPPLAFTERPRGNSKPRTLGTRSSLHGPPMPRPKI
jgi:hypothetical protein